MFPLTAESQVFENIIYKCLTHLILEIMCKNTLQLHGLQNAVLTANTNVFKILRNPAIVKLFINEAGGVFPRHRN